MNEGLTIRSIKNIVYDTLSGYFYLGTFWDGIYRSINNCESWEKISYNIPNTDCIDYAINTNNPDDQIICTPNGLYRTYDRTLSWEHLDILYPDYSAMPTCVLMDRYDPEIIIVGLNPLYWSSDPAYIIRSGDGGASWEPISEGLNTAFGRGITIIDPSDTNRIYLATDQQSAWSITRTTTSIDDDITLPGAFSLFQNYPNPFNPTTTIRYAIAKPARVTLIVYDRSEEHTSELQSH